MSDKKCVGSRQRSLSFLSFLSRRERPLLAGNKTEETVVDLHVNMTEESFHYLQNYQDLHHSKIQLTHYLSPVQQCESGASFST